MHRSSTRRRAPKRRQSTPSSSASDSTVTSCGSFDCTSAKRPRLSRTASSLSTDSSEVELQWRARREEIVKSREASKYISDRESATGPQLYLRPGASTSSTSAVPLITSTPVNSSDLTAGAGQPGPSAPPARPQPPVLEEDMRRIRLLIERDLIEIVVKETGSRFTTDEAQKVAKMVMMKLGPECSLERYAEEVLLQLMLNYSTPTGEGALGFLCAPEMVPAISGTLLDTSQVEVVDLT